MNQDEQARMKSLLEGLNKIFPNNLKNRQNYKGIHEFLNPFFEDEHKILYGTRIAKIEEDLATRGTIIHGELAKMAPNLLHERKESIEELKRKSRPETNFLYDFIMSEGYLLIGANLTVRDADLMFQTKVDLLLLKTNTILEKVLSVVLVELKISNNHPHTRPLPAHSLIREHFRDSTLVSFASMQALLPSVAMNMVLRKVDEFKQNGFEVNVIPAIFVLRPNVKNTKVFDIEVGVVPTKLLQQKHQDLLHSSISKHIKEEEEKKKLNRQFSYWKKK